jgi:hypothetical protein
LLALALTFVFPIAAQNLPLEPFHDTGQGVTPAYEGWYQNPDGSHNILFGYYNRNQKQELDISIGPDNRIEPGGPDRGQPAHFLPGRQWGLFTVTVPKDFGKNKIIWTLTANGKTASIPAGLDPLWEVEPFKDATGNTPPQIQFGLDSMVAQGPKAVTAILTAMVGKPLDLTAWVSDDAKLVPGMRKPRTPPVLISWSKYRGPGEVTFANDHPAAAETSEKQSGAPFNAKVATTATFSEPGDYMLYIVANDWTGRGGGGFQCCWTSAFAKVTVKP